jgi:hypothetical protein
MKKKPFDMYGLCTVMYSYSEDFASLSVRRRDRSRAEWYANDVEYVGQIVTCISCDIIRDVLKILH